MIDDSNDTSKTFIVTVKFKVNGILPSIVTKKHIESNIQSEIEEAVGEVALSSEYYDMQEDIEWAVFLEGDVKVESEEISIDICEEPFCEHCGERHTDFGVQVSDGGTSWCLDCFLSGSHSDVFSEDELNELRKKEKTLAKKYYMKKLMELDDGDDSMDCVGEGVTFNALTKRAKELKK